MYSLLRHRFVQLGPRIWRALETPRRREARHTQAALRASERCCRAMIEHAWDAVSLISAGGRVLYSSPSTPRVLGYPPDHQPAVDALARVHPDDLASVRARFDEVAGAPGRILAATFRNRAADGSWRWIEATGTNLLDDPDVASIVVNYRDVDERQAAEAALRASNARFRGLFDANPQPAWVYDIETLRILEVNDAAVVQYGYSRAEFLALSLLDIRAEAEAARLLARLAQPDPLRGPGEFWWHRRQDGTEFQVEVHVAALDWAGRPARIVVAYDVTDRLLADEAQRVSEQKFRRIVETAQEGIWTIDAEGLTTYANQALGEILGCAPDDMLGASVFDFMDADMRPIVAAWLERRREGVVDRRDFLFRRKDGAEVWTTLASSPFFDDAGRYVGALATVSDITERHRAEATRSRLAAIVEASEDAIFATAGPDWVVASWNRGAERLYGYTPDEILGQSVSVFVPPELAEHVLDTWERLDRGEHVYRSETVRMHKDGRRIDVSVSISPILDTNGRVVGGASIVRDIGDIKRGRQALEETNRRLTTALAEVDRGQQQAVQQERLRAMGEMASGIAHDFNNHLGLILGYSELLLRRPESWDDREAVEESLTTIYTASQDAAAVVRGLRAFYRSPDETGAPMSAIDLGALVEQVATLTQPRWQAQTRARGVTIDLLVETEGAPSAMGVESELRDVLTNLIFNAVDALPEGGTITVRASEEPDAVVLSVADTGTGMSDEACRRCFEPFFTTKGEQGSGLGLSMAYGIVGRHGGTIEVTSPPGHGTTFVIRLPIASPTATAEQYPDAEPCPSLRVLLAEDEPGMRRLTERLLREVGHSVETACDGREALALFGSSTFDLVLTDLAMPEMSGDQLAAAIKRISPDTPVILLTGFGALISRAGERPPGVDVVLSKPMTSAELGHAIEQVCPPSLRSPPPTHLPADGPPSVAVRPLPTV